jgi:hypothetical protein
MACRQFNVFTTVCAVGEDALPPLFGLLGELGLAGLGVAAGDVDGLDDGLVDGLVVAGPWSPPAGRRVPPLSFMP